jgi:hypothetical protein
VSGCWRRGRWPSPANYEPRLPLRKRHSYRVAKLHFFQGEEKPRESHESGFLRLFGKIKYAFNLAYFEPTHAEKEALFKHTAAAHEFRLFILTTYTRSRAPRKFPKHRCPISKLLRKKNYHSNTFHGITHRRFSRTWRQNAEFLKRFSHFLTVTEGCGTAWHCVFRARAGLTFSPCVALIMLLLLCTKRKVFSC